MKTILNYNGIIFNIEIDITKKNGILQEKILNLCNLLIYNIEYCELNINEQLFILGSDQLPFNNTLLDFFKENEESIEEIFIYDRKRDEFGNVLKENYIIKRYNEWYINNENDNYLNYLNNMNSANNLSINSQIIQFPIESILQNILRFPQFKEENLTENNNAEEGIAKENNSEPKTDESNIDDDINIRNNSEEIKENELSDMINIFDRIIMNTRLDYYNLPSNFNLTSINDYEDYSDLPDLIDPSLTDNSNNIFNMINQYEDVKVILSEEQFNNLEHFNYDDSLCSDKDCLICIQSFEDNNEITKIKCNHMFHKKCIKTWLCEESNKCPICRSEIEKGITK